MNKFFKMKNLIKKIILILQKSFLKIFGKLKKKSFWKHSKSFKTCKFNKKNSHSSTYIYFGKKLKIFRHGLGVIFTYWKEVLNFFYFNQTIVTQTILLKDLEKTFQEFRKNKQLFYCGLHT